MFLQVLPRSPLAKLTEQKVECMLPQQNQLQPGENENGCSCEISLLYQVQECTYILNLFPELYNFARGVVKDLARSVHPRGHSLTGNTKEYELFCFFVYHTAVERRLIKGNYGHCLTVPG